MRRYGGKVVVSLPPLRSPPCFSLSLLHKCRGRARRVGESMRGCRLDADNAGGVSFVQSSMTLLSSLLVSLPLRETARGRGMRRDARCSFLAVLHSPSRYHFV